MIVELGHFCLVLACLLSLLMVVVPALGLWRGQSSLMTMATTLAAGMFVFTLLSFLALVQAFVVSDFSVGYVARNSNTLLPLQYKVSAVWGAHEGSFLLWTLVMSFWISSSV